jgi:hypothetical protein
MVIEVRLSQDRIEGLEKGLQLHVDAITQILAGCGKTAVFRRIPQPDFDRTGKTASQTRKYL